MLLKLLLLLVLQAGAAAPRRAQARALAAAVGAGMHLLPPAAREPVAQARLDLVAGQGAALSALLPPGFASLPVEERARLLAAAAPKLPASRNLSPAKGLERALVDAELELVFDNARRHGDAARAAMEVEAAERRLTVRGLRPEAVHEAILLDHSRVFGELAGQGLDSARWTSFVAQLSLASARGLERSARGPEILRRAAASSELRIPAPGGGVVADLLAVPHGAQPPAGRRLFTFLGAPVHGVASGLLLMAWGAVYEVFWAHAASVPAFLAGAAFYGVLLLGSQLVHDLVQAAVQKAAGGRTPFVRLSWIGSESVYDRIPGRPGREFAVAASGVLANAVIGAAALAVGWTAVAQVNFSLALFNLIASRSYDAGRMVRSLLLIALKDERSAHRWMVRVGYAAGVLITALAPAAALLGLLDPVRAVFVTGAGGLAVLDSWRFRLSAGTDPG